MKELEVLFETAKERKANPQPGSYTSYLFEKGTTKILKKLSEECSEVVIAALAQSKEEKIGEMADLLYHLVVLMADQDIDINEVNAELEKRSAKTGNLKPERKPIENL